MKKILLIINNIFIGNTISHIKKFYKSYGIIGVIGFAIAGIGTYMRFINAFTNFISPLVLGKYYKEYNLLDKLQMSYQIDYYNSILGSPAIVNHTSGGKEYLYIGNGFIVQALTDMSNGVIGVGITCTKRDFNYKVGKLVLCNTPFSMVYNKLNESYLGLFNGAVFEESNKGISYFEIYGGYGSDAYRYVVIGNNRAGYSLDLVPNSEELSRDLYEEVPLVFSESSLLFTGYLKTFRNFETINTIFTTWDLSDSIYDEYSNEQYSGEQGNIYYFGPSPFTIVYGLELFLFDDIYINY